MNVNILLNKHLNAQPKIGNDVYIAHSAEIIGDVTVKDRVSIWPQCVLRGDIQSIFIDEETNIQDGTIIHLADELGVKVGKRVVVGHQAVLHACTIEDECLIGMGAMLLDGVHVGKHSIIGARALVTKGTQIPERSLVLGSPAKIIRQVTDQEIADIQELSQKYIQVANAHKKKFGSKQSPLFEKI